MKKDIFKWLVLILVCVGISVYFFSTRYFISGSCDKGFYTSSKFNTKGSSVLDRWTGQVRCK